MPRRATSTSFGGKSGNTQGRGPKKGAPNAGAPTKSLKLFLASVRQSAAAQRALRAAAEDAESRNFGHAWKYLTEYDEEKPAQRISVDVDRLKDMTDDQLRAVIAGKAKGLA